MRIGDLIAEMREFFGIVSQPQLLRSLGFGRKIVPTYCVNPVPEVQAVTFEQNVLVQNVWVEVFSDKNVRIKYLGFDQATANEDIELRVVADDLDETVTQTAVAGTNYALVINADPNSNAQWTLTSAGDDSEHKAFLFEARDLTVYIRKTTAAGANTNTVKILWSRY